jgi:hypothetical protein
MHLTSKWLSISMVPVLCMNSIFAQNITAPILQDTLKGSNTLQRSWWNVIYYNITIKPDYLSKTIVGKNSITYKVVKQNHSDSMQIDLQEPLNIDSVIFSQKHLIGFTELIQKEYPLEISDRCNTSTFF